MALWKLAGSTAIVLVAASSGAFAAVTPEQVWEKWQTLIASSGQTVTTTSVARDGNALVVSGLTFAADDGAGATMTGTIDTMTFTDNGDGTVKVTMSDTYPVTMAFPAEQNGGPTSLVVTVTQPGLSVLAAGDDSQTTYDFSAPTLAVNIKEGATAAETPQEFAVDIAMTDVKGGYIMASANEVTNLTSQFSAATTSFTVMAKDPATKNDVRMSASLEALAGTTGGTFLPAAAMADMVAALKSGFATDSAFTYGKTTFDADIVEGENTSKVTGTAEGGDFTFLMNKDSMSYGTGMKGASFSLSGSDIPFPQVNLSYAEGAFKVLMPIAKSDTPQPFSVLTRVVDLAFSEELWAISDPTGIFPHDPATVILDAKGTANWAYDIMDPAQQAAAEGQVPGQVHSLDVTQLELRAVGAEVKGTGAFTFDNTDLVTWEGIPTPTGKMELTVNGANGVIDKLVQMGVIPEDQAMGARMMIAMFAKPGAGEDSLTSTLEFKDKGFFANGQRLR